VNLQILLHAGDNLRFCGALGEDFATGTRDLLAMLFLTGFRYSLLLNRFGCSAFQTSGTKHE
jgi:hypothetical protein